MYLLLHGIYNNIDSFYLDIKSLIVPLFASKKIGFTIDAIFSETVTLYPDHDLVVFESVQGVCAWRFIYHLSSDGSDYLFLYKGVSCIYSPAETKITKYLKEKYLHHIDNEANNSIAGWLS